MHSHELSRRDSSYPWWLESMDAVEFMFAYLWIGSGISTPNVHQSQVRATGESDRDNFCTSSRPDFGGKHCLGVRKRYRTCTTAVRKSFTRSWLEFLSFAAVQKGPCQSSARNSSELRWVKRQIQWNKMENGLVVRSCTMHGLLYADAVLIASGQRYVRQQQSHRQRRWSRKDRIDQVSRWNAMHDRRWQKRRPTSTSRHVHCWSMSSKWRWA